MERWPTPSFVNDQHVHNFPEKEKKTELIVAYYLVFPVDDYERRCNAVDVWNDGSLSIPGRRDEGGSGGSLKHSELRYDW